MGVHLSGVVAGVAALPAFLAVWLRSSLPLPASIVLWYIAGTGLLVAVAASEQLAAHTTWLLGKVRAATSRHMAGRWADQAPPCSS